MNFTKKDLKAFCRMVRVLKGAEIDINSTILDYLNDFNNLSAYRYSRDYCVVEIGSFIIIRTCFDLMIIENPDIVYRNPTDEDEKEAS